MREPGYYWVKLQSQSPWEACYWDGEEWFNDDPFGLDDNDLAVINETRILNPDEIKTSDNPTPTET